jgi:acetyltransferase
VDLPALIHDNATPKTIPHVAVEECQMSIRNLHFAVRPRSIAVIGGSDREGSVGRVVLQNILRGGFEGPIWPVNPRHRKVQGLHCFRNAKALPEAPDLAVIVTPAPTVPGVIGELGARGCRAGVVVTAGITRENGLRQAMLDAAGPHLFRVLGPNTVGLIIPPQKLDASFAHLPARAGNIALLSQSGAIATALLDWAAANNVGFSHIVSLGDMADVDVGDWLDLLAGDASTRAIVMYLESIPAPRKFMSAARAAARIKPVIAIKSGRHAQAAKAAATHTGALSGADRVVDAALRRAGVLRVEGLSDLFEAAEITARFAPMARSRIGLVTNGGGAGVLAVDRLAELGGELADLTPATLTRLDEVLPAIWSRANPVDIIGDAPAQRYRAAVEAVAADPDVDALAILNCPTGLASPVDAALAVASLSDGGLIGGKPALTCWLGEHTAREGRAILQAAGLPSVETPAQLAEASSFLSDWSRAQTALSRVPSSRGEDAMVDREAALAVFREASRERRPILTEPEAKAVIRAYGIEAPETVVAATPEAVRAAAAIMLARGGKVAVKLLSKAISHKSDVGGVVLSLETAEDAAEAARAISGRVQAMRPDADVQGFTVQPMIERKQAHELILGMSIDPIFGPIVMFGAGGVAVEIVDDTAMALPPIDDVLAGDLIAQTRVGRLLAGFRDRKPADRSALLKAMNGLSRLVVDFPCLVGVDINPLLADANGVIALDARIEIDPQKVEEGGPNPALVIRPYPQEWAKPLTVGAETFTVRPIRPADIALYPDFLTQVSPDDVRLRFLAPRRAFPGDMLKRLTQLDYDRDIAFVALTPAGKLAAVARLSCDPDRERAEYAILVRTDLQGRGVGWSMLHHLIDYARAEKIARLEGIVLADNDKMLAMCREVGFAIEAHPDEPGAKRVTLVL